METNTSVRKELYLAISERLNTLGIYHWIDLWKSQLDSSDHKYPFDFPAAFISIKDIDYEDMTLDVQEGMLAIEILLFFNRYGDTFHTAQDKNKSLDILDNIDKTQQAIQWLEGENFSKLTRRRESDVTDIYKRPAYSISFTSIIYYNLNTNSYVFTS